MDYNFGANHPLKPVRLQNTMSLIRAVAPDIEFQDPGIGNRDDVLRVHSQEFVDFVAALDAGLARSAQPRMGFSSTDTPPFLGIYAASLAYCAGSASAAWAVCDGARLAFNWAGGLHHARKSEASGFCVFNDCALACSILRERFERVLYVDIDLHHGDGVQWIFYDDETVATLSIHESGKHLYPGTGFENETSVNCTAMNIPLLPMTTGDVWLSAFETIFAATVDRFQPGAIVLQMGADAHFRDPLGHLQVAVQEWLAAVELVRDRRLPIVALGGGGYEMSNVPRMWAAATLTLLDRAVPDLQPGSDVPFLDREIPIPRLQNELEAEETVGQLLQLLGS